MSRTRNAMGGRKLFVLPERPAGEASLLIGTTVIAGCFGALFGGLCVVSILLSSPPEASDAIAPASPINSHGVVEAGAMGNPERKL